jgi:hypothetical protein
MPNKRNTLLDLKKDQSGASFYFVSNLEFHQEKEEKKDNRFLLRNINDRG